MEPSLLLNKKDNPVNGYTDQVYSSDHSIELLAQRASANKLKKRLSKHVLDAIEVAEQ